MAAKRNKQQQRRQTKRLLNPTPKQLRKERRAMARSEYRPVLKGLRDDIRISKTNQRQIKQFYGNYRGEIGRSADRSDANSQRLYQESRNTAADLGRGYDDKINRLAAQDAQSAALRGAQNDSSNQQRSLAGESQRQNLMNADSKLLGQLGASSSAYLRNVALASNQGQRLDNRRERNRQQEARNKIREAKRERNAKVNQLRSNQRAAEREWRISRRTLNANIANDQSRLALDRQREGRIASGGGSGGGSRPGGGRPGGGKSGGAGGASPKAQRQAMAYLRQGYTASGGTLGNWRELKANKTSVMDGLINRGVSPAAARAAYNTLLKRWRKKRGGKPSKPGRGDYR